MAIKSQLNIRPEYSLLHQDDLYEFLGLEPLDVFGEPPLVVARARGTTALLVSGAPFSGVTDSLQFLAQQYESGYSRTQRVWVDCERDLSRGEHLVKHIASRLDLRQETNLEALLAKLDEQSGGAGPEIAWLIVVDKLEALSLRQAELWVKSLHAIQSQRAVANGAWLTSTVPICILAGGAVTLDSIVVGYSRQCECNYVTPPTLSEDKAQKLIELVRGHWNEQGITLQEQAIKWAGRELRGDLFSTVNLCEELIKTDRLSKGAVIDVDFLRSILDVPTFLAQRINISQHTLQHIWHTFPDVQRFLNEDYSREIDPGELSPALRESLFRLGCLQLFRRELVVRNRPFMIAMRTAVEREAAGVERTLRTSAFIGRTVGITLKNLIDETNDETLATIRHVLLADLSGSLRFVYYATIESITESEATLWVHSESRGEFVLRLPREALDGDVAEGDSVLYYSIRKPRELFSRIYVLPRTHDGIPGGT